MDKAFYKAALAGSVRDGSLSQFQPEEANEALLALATVLPKLKAVGVVASYRITETGFEITWAPDASERLATMGFGNG